MDLTILFGVFTALMLIGTPIAFCLGIASFATILYLGLPPLVVFQRLASGVEVVRDIDKAPFQAAMGPVYEKYAATPEMKKLVEDIQATE